jgi:SAM-dependent methyltransferase
MSSQELGLVVGHHLLGLEDLHYGLWDEDLDVGLGNLQAAQQRFSDYLLSSLPPPGPGVRVLDVGSGTGRLLEQLLGRGYTADGVSPSTALNERIRARLARHPESGARLFECRFEALPFDELAARYDVVLFSESFQFVRMDGVIAGAQRLLKPRGLLVICDVFRTAREGDGGSCDGVIRGGHSLAKLEGMIAGSPFVLEDDDDITARASPTIAVLTQVLEERVRPAGSALLQYLQCRHPTLGWLLGRLLGSRLRRIAQRYFGGCYTPQTFERYKTYRRLVYRLSGA